MGRQVKCVSLGIYSVPYSTVARPSSAQAIPKTPGCPWTLFTRKLARNGRLAWKALDHASYRLEQGATLAVGHGTIFAQELETLFMRRFPPRPPRSPPR